MSNSIQTLIASLQPAKTPLRDIQVKRFRLFASVFASTASSITFFVVYYATLGLLPPTYVASGAYHPSALWNERMDIAQFFGVLLDPPYATRLSWILGSIALLVVLISAGVVFAILCSWALTRASAATGILFGSLLFFILGAAVSLGSGYNPGVMRQTLPDVGFFFFGWTGWATLQLLVASVAYGWTWGKLYGGLTSGD